MIIRTAKLSDFDFVRECKEMMFEQHQSYDPRVFSDSWKYTFRAYIHELIYGNHIISTLDNGERVGYAYYTIKQVTSSLQRPIRSLFIQEFFIMLNHRRSHIGKGLIENLVKRAKKEHCTCIKLYCYDKNLCGLSFYDSCGFEKQYTTLMRYV